MFMVPCPEPPPNPKSPDPLSQPSRNLKGVLVPKHQDVPPPEAPLTPSALTPSPSPQATLKVCLQPHIRMFHPMFMAGCACNHTSGCSCVHGWMPRGPLTPSPLTPSPSPQATLKVCLQPHIRMFHLVFMAGCPEAPLTPSPLTPSPPSNPKVQTSGCSTLRSWSRAPRPP